MVKLFKFLAGILLSFNSFGQSFPGCSDLAVEKMEIDSTGKLAVTISNRCMNCMYGGQGCVYAELRVIRTVVPFDTIAASNCWCLHWEDPNVHGTLQTFHLNTNLTSVPPVSDLRVNMAGCGCDTIPFSAKILNVGSLEVKEYSLFPNPTGDILKINNPIGIIKQVQITDVRGKVMLVRNTVTNGEVLEIGHLVKGMYFITFYKKSGEVLEAVKVIKQ